MIFVMTAKQYLRQALRLNEKIDANMLELERLRALATAVSSPDLSQDRVRASGVSDRIGNIVAKIVDLEEKINAEIDKFVGLKKEIRERLSMMPDDDLRLILQKRYINFQKWEQIAVDMNFTFQWVHVLHKRALNEFKKFMSVDFN
jgi:hypothetical protein